MEKLKSLLKHPVVLIILGALAATAYAAVRKVLAPVASKLPGATPAA